MKFQRPTRLRCLEDSLQCWLKRACQPCLMAYRERLDVAGTMDKIMRMEDPLAELLAIGIPIWTARPKAKAELIGQTTSPSIDMVEVFENKGRRNVSKEVQALAARYEMDLVRQTTHLVFKHRRTGVMVSVSKTPSDRRALQNIERDMRRASKNKEKK